MAVIPSRYEPDRLRSVVDAVKDEAEVLVLDNGHDALDLPCRVVDSRGLGIYAMWNRGWASARHEGYDAVALLNDDIRILPGTLRIMADALDRDTWLGVAYPDWPLPVSAGLPERVRLEYTAGTVSAGGMTGFCFMFRSALRVAPFDERFGWWYGDDAFERSVRRRGYRVARIKGLPCEHVSDSEANGWERRPELREVVVADKLRWEAMQ